MTDTPERPLLADVRAEIGSLGVELREIATARWELARLEIEADFRSTLRLAVAWLVAIVMLLTSLPLMLAGLAESLNGWAGIPRGAWFFAFAAGLLFLSSFGGYLAWHRFRRNFLGLKETLEELQEDILWLKEKSGKQK